MQIQDILERYPVGNAPDAEVYIARLGETEALFDYLTDSLLVSGDIVRYGGNYDIFRSIDLGHYALDGSTVRVVAQPSRKIIPRIHTPDRVKRSIRLKIPDQELWLMGSDERLTLDNSRQIGCVSINTAFQTATPRSLGRLEEFRSVLDELLACL